MGSWYRADPVVSRSSGVRESLSEKVILSKDQRRGRKPCREVWGRVFHAEGTAPAKAANARVGLRSSEETSLAGVEVMRGSWKG